MTDNNPDIRWEQRFLNYKKALAKLTQAVEYINQTHSDKKNIDFILDEILKEGLIQRFEYTHELAWNVMRDYERYQGLQNISGSRDAVREAFQIGLITDGSVWMDMISSRNRTSHTYDEATAESIYSKIINQYYPVFLSFADKMETLKE